MIENKQLILKPEVPLIVEDKKEIYHYPVSKEKQSLDILLIEYLSKINNKLISIQKQNIHEGVFSRLKYFLFNSSWEKSISNEFSY